MEKAKPLIDAPKKKQHRNKLPVAPLPFNELLMHVNNRDDYNSGGCVYIDSDLHEILRHIKLKNKLKVGFLVSWLIEQFVVENQQDISDLLKVKKNKYMDR